MFLLRHLPTHEGVHEHAGRYGSASPDAVELWLVLLRVASDVFARFEEFLSEHGLSQGRFTVLMLLNCDENQGTASPSELSEAAGVSRAAMTAIIDGLEKEGLVAREPHPEDRRKLGVRISDRGRGLMEGIVPGFFAGIDEQLRALQPADQQALVQQLLVLRQSVVPGEELVRKTEKSYSKLEPEG